MSVDVTIKWIKEGATFANGEAAYANKNALYPAELTNAISACWANMLANGILLEPITRTWDQDECALVIRRVVSSQEAFEQAITFDSAESTRLSQDAGWTL